jgi:hypothetical protein
MDDQPKVYEWTAPLGTGGSGDGSGAFFLFPWDTKECFGKANLVPVWAEFDGEPYRGSLANMGEGPCIVMLKQIREKLGKKPGDLVTIRLWLDTEPRVVEAPADLAEALVPHGAAQAFWDKLSPGNRRLFVNWIDDAKRPETRANRVAKTVEKMARGEKFA